MTTVNLTDFQGDFLTYMRRVEAGESIVIADDQRPIAEVKPVATSVGEPRPFGLCRGEFSVPDDFDAPLPEEVLRDFEL
jgi:antitoxin (DNA-binding transcriptional repressor) of toxin-antitoxin stability system